MRKEGREEAKTDAYFFKGMRRGIIIRWEPIILTQQPHQRKDADHFKKRSEKIKREVKEGEKKKKHVQGPHETT